MDEGPFRASRSADKKVAARPEPARRQPVVEQPAEEQPRVVPQAVTPAAKPVKKSSSKRFKLPVIITLSVIVLALAAWFAVSQQNSVTAIQADKYQAVFFTNGQVYFGKLHTFHGGDFRLTDIYYLQTQNATSTDSKNPQQTTTDQNNVQLIKLGDEIHGPQDEMIISKDQVLFYENLKSDGKVAQSIVKYKK